MNADGDDQGPFTRLAKSLVNGRFRLVEISFAPLTAEPRHFESTAKLLEKCFPKRDYRSITVDDVVSKMHAKL